MRIIVQQRHEASLPMKYIGTLCSIRAFKVLISIIAIFYSKAIHSTNIGKYHFLNHSERKSFTGNGLDSSQIYRRYGNSMLSLHTLSLSSINRGAFSYGMTYHFELKTDNPESSFKVFGFKNDLSVEIINSYDSKIHYGICNTVLFYGFGFRYKNSSRRDLTLGCDLHYTPTQPMSYSILPKIGIMNLGIWDLTYSFNIKSRGIYSGYSPHNIGLTYRLGYLIKGLSAK